jgi:hypothetical protein
VNPKKNKEVLSVKLAFDLCDYSDTLSFDEVMSTLFVVGQYVNNTDHRMFNKKDLPIVESWLERNNIDKFFLIKMAAIEAQSKLDREKQKAKETISTPYKKESWH